MSIPKVNKQNAPSSRFPKRQPRSRRTATTPMVSGPSKKKESNPSPAPTSHPPTNLPRVLVVDCRDSITWDAFSNWDWWEMWDLIISTDYNQNVFNVLKIGGENVLLIFLLTCWARSYTIHMSRMPMRLIC